jgi:hypothetical protein
MTRMLAGSMDRSPPSAAECASTASNEVQTAHADVMQTDPSRDAGFHISAGLSVRKSGLLVCDRKFRGSIE